MIRYILVDDDGINNTICKMCIKKTLGDVEIVAFTDPQAGFNYLSTEYSKPETTVKSILLLDINMPVISGWDFLELFEDLEEITKKKLSIYILSSSINQQDIEKANNSKHVIGFLSKPLTKDEINRISC